MDTSAADLTSCLKQVLLLKSQLNDAKRQIQALTNENKSLHAENQRLSANSPINKPQKLLIQKVMHDPKYWHHFADRSRAAAAAYDTLTHSPQSDVTLGSRISKMIKPTKVRVCLNGKSVHVKRHAGKAIDKLVKPPSSQHFNTDRLVYSQKSVVVIAAKTVQEIPVHINLGSYMQFEFTVEEPGLDIQFSLLRESSRVSASSGEQQQLLHWTGMRTPAMCDEGVAASADPRRRHLYYGGDDCMVTGTCRAMRIICSLMENGPVHTDRTLTMLCLHLP